MNRADLVITTGGLGPTSDDLTRELVAELLGRNLVRNAEVLAHIEDFFAKRGRPRPPKTDVETMVPEGALVFLNPTGTAPGLAMRVDADEFPAWNGTAQPRPAASFRPPATRPKWLVMLPGPPRELRPMFDDAVVPLLQREFAAENFRLPHAAFHRRRASRACRRWIEAALQPLVAAGLGSGLLRPSRRGGCALDRHGDPGSGHWLHEGEAVVQCLLGAHIYRP